MDRDVKHKYDLVRAFPRELENDVRHVLDVMYQELLHNYSGVEEFRLSGETLHMPYRIYNYELNRSQISSLTACQQTILFSIYTRPQRLCVGKQCEEGNHQGNGLLMDNTLYRASDRGIC